MKRSECYKEYYRITDRSFSDHRVWSAEDREQAWWKGEGSISKKERKFLIVGQYLFLLGAVICFLLSRPELGIVGCVVFLLQSLLADFSVLKVELLYWLFQRRGPYSELLHLAFLGQMDSFWDSIRSETKLVSGFARVDRNKFAAKYQVVFRKSRENVFLILKPSGVHLRSKSCRVVFNDPALSLPELAKRIAEALQSERK